MGSMTGLIKNEIVKFITNKKIFIFVIAVVVASISIIGSCVSSLDSTKEEFAKGVVPDGYTVEEMQKKIEEADFLESSSMNEIKDYYQEEMDKLKSQNNFATDERAQLQYNYYKYLYDNNIKMTSSLNPDSNNFMQNTLSTFSFISIFLIIICVTESVSSEYSEGNFKVLFTKPFSRAKIVIGKFLSNVIIISFLTIFYEVLMYVVGGIIKGFSSFNYPAEVFPLISQSDNFDQRLNGNVFPVFGTSKLITQGELFIKSFFIQIVFIAALTALVMLVSFVFKKGLISAFMCMVFAMLNLSLGSWNGPALGKLLGCLFPFKYYDPLKIVNHQLISDTAAYYLNDFTMILIPLLWIGLCLFLCCKYVNRKNAAI